MKCMLAAVLFSWGLLPVFGKPASSDGSDASLLGAVERNDVVAVKVFLDQGANVNEMGSGGMTALQLAASEGKTEIVKFLLSRGATRMNGVEAPMLRLP